MSLLGRVQRAIGGGPREFMLIRVRGQPSDPSKVKSYDRPRSPHEIELEEDLPPGVYKLQEVDDRTGNFGKVTWSGEHLFGDESEIEDAIERAERAERRAASAEEKASSSPGVDLDSFDDPAEALRHQVRLAAIQDEKFMSEFGQEVLSWAFSQGSEPTVDAEIDSLSGLMMYETFRNPEQAGQLAETIGGRLSKGLREGLEGDGQPQGISAILGTASSDDATQEADGDEESGHNNSIGAPTATDDHKPSRRKQTGADLDLIEPPEADAEAATDGGEEAE